MNVTAPTTIQTTQVGLGSGPTPTKQEEPIVHLRTSEKSRAAQKEIAKSFNGIDSGSVLSSAGLKMVLGEPTKFANLKDGVVHLMHKISDKLAPNAVGSHYKEALRLADEYQAIVIRGGSLSEQLAAVKNLHAQLEAHSPGGAQGESVEKLVKFAQLEIKALEAGIKQEGQDAQAKLDHDSHRVDVIVGELVEDRALSGGSLRDEIQSFDRTSLKHVTPPKEQGVPEWAKNEFEDYGDQMDSIDAHPRGVVRQEPLMLQEPGISSLSTTFKATPEFIGMGPKVETALGSGDGAAIKTLTEDMARELMKDISSQGPLSERAFAISDGAKFKEELYKSLVTSNPGGVKLAGSYRDASPEALAFLDGVYSAMLDQLSDRQTAPDKILIGGKEYTKGAKLGEGGFGDVHLYEHTREVTDPTTGEKSKVVDRIAVKSFKSGNLEEAAQEVRAHQSAMGPQGHENITAMKGVVRTPGGGVLIAMDLAKTDGYAMMANLDKAVAEGRLTPVAANAVRLTILKDMLRGMQHFQEVRGMTHLDVKEPNFFVGQNGKMMLGDFGFAKTGDRQVLEGRLVDNPSWKAPEIIIQEEERSAITTAANRQLKAELELLRLQHPNDPDLLKQLYDQFKADIGVTTQLKLDMLGGTIVTNKADTWAIGVSAYRLFHGKSPFYADFMSDQQRLIVEHGSDTDNTIRELGRDEDGDSTGKAVTAMDRLFNQMLNPDPAKRPSVTDLLRNPVFQEPFVGGDEAYAIIQELSEENPDPAKLKALSDKIGD